VKAVTQIAHDHGALVVDDGYQSQGNILVEPAKDGVDFYARAVEQPSKMAELEAQLTDTQNAIREIMERLAKQEK
jgi:hypothetical protein